MAARQFSQILEGMDQAVFEIARDLIIINGRKARPLAEDRAASGKKDGEEDIAAMWRQIAEEIHRIVPSG